MSRVHLVKNKKTSNKNNQNSSGGKASQLIMNSSLMQQKSKNQQSIFGNNIIQKKENNTGLPSNLKSGIESLSGIDMSDVKVHYNSSKPAQLNAFAFAQGNNIHLGSGQEKHLPHEAWHVVQQKQGRVKATTQMKGRVPINDDIKLEREADIMGSKALQFRGNKKSLVQKKSKGVVQKTLISAKEYKSYGARGNDISPKIEKLNNKLYIFRNKKVKDTKPSKDINPIKKSAKKIIDEINIALDDSLNVTIKEYKSSDIVVSDLKDDCKVLDAISQEIENNKVEKNRLNSVYFDKKKGFFTLNKVEANGKVDEGMNKLFASIDIGKFVTLIKNNAKILKEKSLNEDVIISSVEKFKDSSVFSKILSVIGVAGLIFSIKDTIDTKKRYDIFKEGKKDNSSILKDLEYGMAKIHRAFWTKMIKVAMSLISLLSKIINFFTAGAFSAIQAGIEAFSTVTNFAHTLFRKTKGLWKIITGKRGKARKKHATNIVEKAFSGDKKARKFIIKIVPDVKANLSSKIISKITLSFFGKGTSTKDFFDYYKGKIPNNQEIIIVKNDLIQNLAESMKSQ